jgi:hypothetical protein
MSKNYFTSETEDAIVLYNNTQDEVLKNEIYQNYIHYPFFKLTENLIHTFKYYYTEVENLEDLQHEVIIFLLSKMHRFDPELGYKAYSFFGTIAKRYLIKSNEKNYKKKIDKSSLDVVDENITHSYSLDEQMYEEHEEPTTQGKLNKYIDNYIEYCTDNIYTLFPVKEKSKDYINDARIADAVLELFRKREHINIFNKKALYIYIKEQADVTTPRITKVVDKLKYIFNKGYLFYLENGYIKFD